MKEWNPFVSSGIVCYAEKKQPLWSSSLGQRLQFDTLKFRITWYNYFGQFVRIETKVTGIVAFQFMKRRLKISKNSKNSKTPRLICCYKKGPILFSKKVGNEGAWCGLLLLLLLKVSTMAVATSPMTAICRSDPHRGRGRGSCLCLSETFLPSPPPVFPWRCPYPPVLPTSTNTLRPPPPPPPLLPT